MLLNPCHPAFVVMLGCRWGTNPGTIALLHAHNILADRFLGDERARLKNRSRCCALRCRIDRRALRSEASYESSVAEAFGNLPSSPAYLSPAFLKAEPSSMNFRC